MDKKQYTPSGKLIEPPSAKEIVGASEAQRTLLRRRIVGKNSEMRIEAALLFISGLCTSSTKLAAKFNKSRNTILNWRSKDGWLDLESETASLVGAKLAPGVADWKIRKIQSLEEDLNLIDKIKHQVKPKSLEGLLKAKTVILEALALLRGEATQRTEMMLMAWEAPTPDSEPRGAIPIRGIDLSEDSYSSRPAITGLDDDALPGDIAEAIAEGRTPRYTRPAFLDNTAESQGVLGSGEGRKGDPIAIARGDVKDTDGGDKVEAGSGRIRARGGRRLSGGRTTTVELKPGEL